MKSDFYFGSHPPKNTTGPWFNTDESRWYTYEDGEWVPVLTNFEIHSTGGWHGKKLSSEDKMSDKNDGGPAFPEAYLAEYLNKPELRHSKGMTLRDYLAAKALMGLIASTQMLKPPSFEEYAKCAYEHADEMIKQRAK